MTWYRNFEIQHLNRNGGAWQGGISQAPVKGKSEHAIRVEAKALAQSALDNGAERAIVTLDGHEVVDLIDE